MTNKRDICYNQSPDLPGIPKPGRKPEPWGKTDIVGQPRPRVDAYERVSGKAVYPSDLIFTNMKYGAILRSPHPNARIKKIDLSPAERMPGVRAVVGVGSENADVWWTYQDDASSKLFDPRVRFEGEAVAAVAADTPYQARDALKAIVVEYEVLPFLADERKALEKESPPVHDSGNLVGPVSTYSRGDTALGFSRADVVLEREYRTESGLHTPLELHGCVASWTREGLTVWESTQGVYAVQEEIAEALSLPLSKVRVIGHYLGGGFGSKLRTGKYSVIAALLSRQAGCPVKLFLSREETFLCTGNRPPANMKLKAGVKKDGTLTAIQFSAVGTGGAYPAGGAALLDWLVRDHYLCPNVLTEVTDVFINAGPARPFRAPGLPQGSWALEQMMDELAESIEMDPVAFRLKNIPDYSQAREGRPPYTSTGLKECIVRGAEDFGWEKARKEAEKSHKSDRRRGVGMAGCLWFVGGGGPPSTVLIKIFSDGSVNLNMGASDIGTGTKTVMAMVASEELGVAPESIQIEWADTGTTQYATASGGSKTVPTEAPAVRAAAIDAKRQLLEMAARDLDRPVEDLVYQGSFVAVKDDPSQRIEIPRISGLKQNGVVMGIGCREPNPRDKVVNPFAAQFCEVEVNMKTGEVDILRFLGAHDSGRVMNRLTYDNQVFGGIVMGIGLAATEFRVLDQKSTGKLCNRNWHDYKLPTALDVPPDMTCLPIEIDDPEANITGSKGLGEPATIPAASAIANAVCHATGIRVFNSPINPVTMSALLNRDGKEG